MCYRCDYEELLRRKDLAVTDNRLRVLEVIGDNNYPLSARDIFETL
jgi:Fur family transcriptional regulator, ferric uptake regulator